MKRILIIALAVIMSGCASMNADQCAMSDWHAVGYEDGSRGYTSDRFGQYRKACAKHSVAPDFQAYQVGRKEGLVEYCQPSRGFNLGAAGGRYNGVCDVAMEEEFLDAYRVGSQLYTLRSNVNRVNGAITSREQRIAENVETIAAKQATLIAADTTVEDRVLILADLKRLSEEQGELEAEIEQLIDERARHETELADYQTTVAAHGY
jgi:hypothetical protein